MQKLVSASGSNGRCSLQPFPPSCPCSALQQLVSALAGLALGVLAHDLMNIPSHQCIVSLFTDTIPKTQTVSVTAYEQHRWHAAPWGLEVFVNRSRETQVPSLSVPRRSKGLSRSAASRDIILSCADKSLLKADEVQRSDGEGTLPPYRYAFITPVTASVSSCLHL